MIRSSWLRRAMLVIIALVFLAIALASAVRPHSMAAGLGYRLDSTDALSEFRAVYVGLWVATAVVFLVAARRVEDALLGDLAAILVLGQVAGRLLSLVLDGLPSRRLWPISILEAVGGIALLLVRPGASREGGRLQ